MIQKKQVLFLSPVIPSNNGAGVNRRAAKHVLALSREFDTHVLIISLYKEQEIDTVPEEIASQCASIHILEPKLGARRIPKSFPFGLALNELHSPEGSFRLSRRKITDDTYNRVSNRSFDVVFCFRTNVANALSQIQKAFSFKFSIAVVDFDDIESSYISRQRKVERDRHGFQYDLMLHIREKRQRKLEVQLLKRFDIISICSTKDKTALKNAHDNANVVVLPNCVDCHTITKQNREGHTFNILFVGTMSYAPNEDAILYFYNEIMPRIREKSSQPFHVHIVGFNPSEAIKALEQDLAVTVTGGVESVDEYYRAADCVIAPIRFGAGTRIKILEAMSFGKPVISTSLGAEGITDESGVVALLADDPEVFSLDCVALMTNSNRCEEIGKQGREFVEREFSVANCYNKLLEELGSAL